MLRGATDAIKSQFRAMAQILLKCQFRGTKLSGRGEEEEEKEDLTLFFQSFWFARDYSIKMYWLFCLALKKYQSDWYTPTKFIINR